MKQLPLLKKITIDRLRDLVIEVWTSLWQQSPYQDLTEAPNFLSELGGDETLLRHTNAVTEMAEAISGRFGQIYNVNINFDILLAGGLLHDVDKLVLYERQGDSVHLTELGRRVAHGEYGALAAEQAGLPQEVVNIIASHSPIKRKTLPATIEAVLVACCDEANFQSYRLMIGKELWVKP